MLSFTQNIVRACSMFYPYEVYRFKKCEIPHEWAVPYSPGFSLESHKRNFFSWSTFEWSIKITPWATPCWFDSQNPFSGDSKRIATIFACVDSLAHVVGLGRVSASEVEGVRRNLYLPSLPTCTHPGAPPCTHRSVNCVRSISDFSTLRQHNLTWVGIECRLLRAQEDSVSRDGQHQRFASSFHPLDSSTRNGLRSHT